MNSNKIIPSYILKKKKKDIPDLTKKILTEYFNGNYKRLSKLSKFNILTNENNIKKITYIVNALKLNDKINKFKTVTFVYIYKKLLSPFISHDLQNRLSYNKQEIENRFDAFFVKQETIDNVDRAVSLINYQYITLKYFDVYIKPLINKKNHYIHSQLYSEPEINQTEPDKNILSFVKTYVDQYYVQKEESKYKHPPLDEFSTENVLIYKFLEQMFQNIIKITQRLNSQKTEHDFQLVTYGSYTSYVLNNNVKYNDIDIYHVNPLNFLTTIMLLCYFILDLEIEIFRIPYIIGHLSLRYKGKHFSDCIYMDLYTLKSIPTITINECLFIDPLIQMINNFRMMSEIRRMDAVTKDRENTYLKYTTLLDFANKTLGINYETLKPIDFNIKLINDTFLQINLNNMFRKYPEYKTFQNSKTFDYLIISLMNPKNFLMLLNRNDVLISKQYFAFFNEIVAEFNNKHKSENYAENKRHVRYNNLNQHEESSSNFRVFNIQESDIGLLELPTNNEFTTDLKLTINNNNVLLMTNFSTDIFIKILYNEQHCLINKEVSNISKETILSSFVLYNLLKIQDKSLIKFYVTMLLSFLKFNQKFEDIELLAKADHKKHNIVLKSNSPEFNTMIKFKKIKLTGQHALFSIPLMNLKNIFFYKNQDENYFSDIGTFLESTTYNTYR